MKTWFRLLSIGIVLVRLYFPLWDRRPLGLRLRLALEKLGPIFIKFGQALSTRRDLLPVEIADELAKLQDNVPPFPGEAAKAIIERALKQPLAHFFSDFQEQPLASASVAQVHAARLLNGKEVVVKVLRPKVEKRIKRDIKLLRLIARLVEAAWEDGYRLRPQELVSEFERTILDELDLTREAANTSLLRRNFLHSPLLYVPEVYWPAVRKNVLVMERVYGIPISNISALKEKQVNLKRLAERGVEIFFTQVFRDRFFHADMHPGNIFVSVEDPQEPKYIAVDCGIVGTLSPQDQQYLAANFLAFFRRDYRRVAELHVESKWVPAKTNMEAFETAIRTIAEPIFEKPLREISFAQLLLKLFQVARQFNMTVQPQLALLQKTLFNIEGLGREIYPDLDLWATAKPFLERWMKSCNHPKTLFKLIAQDSLFWTEKVARFPSLFYNFIERQQNKGEPLKEQMLDLTGAHQRLQGLMRYQILVLIGLGIAVLVSLF